MRLERFLLKAPFNQEAANSNDPVVSTVKGLVDANPTGKFEVFNGVPYAMIDIGHGRVHGLSKPDVERLSKIVDKYMRCYNFEVEILSLDALIRVKGLCEELLQRLDEYQPAMLGPVR